MVADILLAVVAVQSVVITDLYSPFPKSNTGQLPPQFHNSSYQKKR
jgi:hypothetical protein